MNTAELHLLAGWIGMLLGVLSGVGLGLYFHRDDFAGGYASFRRRMIRLGHVSFFGLGFINLFYGFTLKLFAPPIPFPALASTLFILGAITMPLCCYLSAWKASCRRLFPLPVICIGGGILLLLLGWF